MVRDRPHVSIIAAVANNGVIGAQGGLPWRLSADLRQFKRRTMGHTIIMGRKTFESIGRALPGRYSVVISRHRELVLPAGVQQAADMPAALEAAQQGGFSDTAFVIGGRQVFAAAIPLAERIYLTRVCADVPGDVYFPDVDWSAWLLVTSESHAQDAHNEYATTVEMWQRRELDASLLDAPSSD